MRLLKLLEAIQLQEAAKDRYMQTFTPILPYVQQVNPHLEQAIISAVDWAVPTLRKSDKIVWFLRWIKVEVLRTLSQNTQTLVDGKPAVDEEVATKINAMYEKASSQMAAKSRIAAAELSNHSQQVATADFRRNMEHYMSLGIQAIEDYVFNWKTPQEIWADWRPIERIWQERQSKFLDIDYNTDDEKQPIESLIKYPDNSEWVNLNRPYCDLEADAMGHCANSASYTENDTLLSYRTVEKDDNGKERWVPHLTFVLDKETGLLGETKGRENQKPDGKYHGVIMDLLKLPLIQGIRGGGYKPENNFKMDDLPADVADKMIDEKPALASIAHDYKKRGMTRSLLARMEAMWEDTQVAFPEYKKSRKAFMADPQSKDVDGFAREYGGDTVEWMINVFTGDTFQDFDSGYGDPKDLWEAMPSKTVAYVGKWLLDNYDSDVEEWKEENDTNFDPTNLDAIWDIMSDSGIDEVSDILRNAMSDGVQRGTETEMHNAFTDWLGDLPTYQQFSNISLYPGTSAYDSPQMVEIPEDLMIDFVSDYIDEIENHGDLVGWLDIQDVVAPYQGWDDYDEKHAIEVAVDNIGSEL